MKTALLFITCLFSLQLQAAACKCNCNPADIKICASSYDIDHPCGSICPSQGSINPMLTACPLVQVANPVTGVNMWITTCPE